MKNIPLWVLIVLAASPLLVFVIPQLMGLGAYIVDSGSMEPSLQRGTVVFTEEAEPSRLSEGDVIVFQPNRSRIDEKRVIHRIKRVKTSFSGYKFVTKGDANPEEDPGATPDYRVLGKKVMDIPLLGHYVKFLNSDPLSMLLLLLPGGYLIKKELMNILDQD